MSDDVGSECVVDTVRDDDSNGSPKPECDRAMVRRILRGDQRAAKTLYDTQAPLVYRQAYRRCNDADCAQDLTQLALIRVFRKLDGFRGQCALSSWVYRIASNVIATHVRREHRRANALAREFAASGATVCDTGLPDPIATQRVRAAVWALPPIYRESVILHDVHGYKHWEIANGLGVPIGTSKSRLTFARRYLRAALQ